MTAEFMAGDQPISEAEAAELFADLEREPALVLAVSGGPDSTALMWLAARWRDGLKLPPDLIAVTIDHGLRTESAAEARAVATLARKLKVAHRTLHWAGPKPKTGIQETARNARYRLLADASRKARARRILTAHTLDDQAETVLFRLARGSGLTGLRGMARTAPLPVLARQSMQIVRPLLPIPKSRLLATLRNAKISFADDASNRDPRFTRPRLRALMPGLAAEGLDAARLATLARRMVRADEAVERAVDEAEARLRGRLPTTDAASLAVGYAELPAEVALRLLGRVVAKVGDEGPVELAKLEALHAALIAAIMEKGRAARFRRTLAGALVTLGDGITVERAPARRFGRSTGGKPRKSAFTKPR